MTWKLPDFDPTLVAVADTGPLHYLVLLERDYLLGKMFNGVVIANAVLAELSDAEAPRQVRDWIASPPSWLSVSEQPSAEVEDLPKTLGRGERPTITLAASLRPQIVLMDDRAAVTTARARGLLVTGTLGLLYRAALAGLIDLPAAFEQLKTTNFHYTQALLDALVTRFEAAQP